MKTAIIHKNFTVYVDKKGNLVHFEANTGIDIGISAKSIVNYLRHNKIEGDYVLKFCYQRLKISKDINPDDVVKEYYDKIESLSY